MTGVDMELQEIFDAEEQALALAEESLMRYRPFDGLPETVAMRQLSVWQEFLSKFRISKREATGLVRSDLEQSRIALRGSTATLHHIGQQRMAVLYHVTLLMGSERMKDLGELWAALRAGDYEAASDCLMMSEWPRMVGDNVDNRRLVLDLVRTMRTGQFSLNRIAP